VQPAKHFQHCADKVEAGKGWHGEDCVEELFHLMHCVDVSGSGLAWCVVLGH
jgi:ubiquinol-cytochrome c reductase subunit 6